MISFSLVPAGIRTPGTYIEIDNSRAIRGLPAIVNKVLVIGQRLATGTVNAGVPTRVLSTTDADTFFGRGSQISAMLTAFLAANRYADLRAIALDDDSAGAAATGTIEVTSVSSAAGTLAIYIAGKRITVGVPAAMTVAAAATAIAAAINADTTLPVTAAAAAGVVTLTARNEGENGNAIDVRLNYYVGDVLPAGQAVTITPMAGGTGNPDIATAIAAMADQAYTTVVMPFTDASNLTKLETELNDRFGPIKQAEGLAFAAVPGTFSTATTLGESRNSPMISIMGSGKSPTPPWVFAAVIAAVDAAEPDPARPRQTLALPGVLPPVEGQRFAQSERNLLLYSGISTFVVDAGDVVRIERLITTYRETANGTPDESYLDVETMRTLAYVRTAFRSAIALTYPRHKLADDGTSFGVGQAVATPKLIRATLQHTFAELEDAGLVEGRDQFNADLIVERDPNDRNRVNALLPPDLVNQLRVVAAELQFIK